MEPGEGEGALVECVCCPAGLCWCSLQAIELVLGNQRESPRAGTGPLETSSKCLLTSVQRFMEHWTLTRVLHQPMPMCYSPFSSQRNSQLHQLPLPINVKTKAPRVACPTANSVGDSGSTSNTGLLDPNTRALGQLRCAHTHPTDDWRNVPM